jgi:hypothetical protein
MTKETSMLDHERDQTDLAELPEGSKLRSVTAVPAGFGGMITR